MRLHTRYFQNRKHLPDLPDVILIHGTGANGSLWQPQVDLLTGEGYRCIVPELRGHGLTHEPEEPTGLNVHIQDLLETLPEYNVRYPAIWIGHSLGAIISMELAQHHPEFFLEILAIGLPGKVLPVVSTLFRWFLCTPFELIRGTLLHKKLPIRHQLLIETQRHSLEQIVQHFQEINLVDRQHQISCPIHFSVGRFDVVAPFIHTRNMHNRLPNSTFKIFEWAGHSCMDDRPQEFNAWLLDKVKTGYSTKTSEPVPNA